MWICGQRCEYVVRDVDMWPDMWICGQICGYVATYADMWPEMWICGRYVDMWSDSINSNIRPASSVVPLSASAVSALTTAVIAAQASASASTSYDHL